MTHVGRGLRSVFGFAVTVIVGYFGSLYASYQDRTGHDFAWHVKAAAQTAWWLYVLAACGVIWVLYFIGPALARLLIRGPDQTRRASPLAPGAVPIDAMMLQFILARLDRSEGQLEEANRKLQGSPRQPFMDQASREAAVRAAGEMGKLTRERDDERLRVEALSAEIATVRDALGTQTALAEKLHAELRAARPVVTEPPAIAWEAVVPSMPGPAQTREKHYVDRNAPIFTITLGIGDYQEIAFGIGLRIELLGISRAAALGGDTYAAEVYVDAMGALVGGGEYTERLDVNKYRLPRRQYDHSEGFSVYFLHMFSSGYRVFSAVVTHINHQRGTVTFRVLCAERDFPE